jgi:hypothetical protein
LSRVDRRARPSRATTCDCLSLCCLRSLHSSMEIDRCRMARNSQIAVTIPGQSARSVWASTGLQASTGVPERLRSDGTRPRQHPADWATCFFDPAVVEPHGSGDNDDPCWLNRLMHCSHACCSIAVCTNTTAIWREVSWGSRVASAPSTPQRQFTSPIRGDKMPVRSHKGVDGGRRGGKIFDRVQRGQRTA